MKVLGTHPKKLNDPVIGHPAMKGRRWQIDYSYGPHSSYKKILHAPKKDPELTEFAVDNMDTWTDTRHNDVDIGYNEFYDELDKAEQPMNQNDYTVDVDIEEPAIDESKNSPTNKKLWARAKSMARSKFDVYPSAYANAWAAKWYKKHGGGWRKNENITEVSQTGGIIIGQNPNGKASTTKNTSTAQTTNPSINTGYSHSKGPVEGSGEEETHNRPYDFFQYKKDNAKFGNGNIVKPSGRVSLKELAKQVIDKLNDEK